MHKAQHAGRRRGVVDRRAEHDAVGLLDQRQHVGHRAAEHAFARLAAAAAAHTAANRRRADVENRRLDARFVQHLGHLGQGCVGAAVFVRTAVDQQYIHSKYLRFGFALITIVARLANDVQEKGRFLCQTPVSITRKNAAAARCWRCPTVNSLPKTGPPAGAAGRVCPVKAVQGMAEPLHYRNKAIASFATQRARNSSAACMPRAPTASCPARTAFAGGNFE